MNLLFWSFEWYYLLDEFLIYLQVSCSVINWLLVLFFPLSLRDWLLLLPLDLRCFPPQPQAAILGCSLDRWGHIMEDALIHHLHILPPISDYRHISFPEYQGQDYFEPTIDHVLIRAYQ